MTITDANIYSGPINKLEISTDGGTTYTDMGAIGDGANVETTFEPNKTDLGDGQKLTKFGTFKLKAVILETHTSNLTLLKTAETTAATVRVTGLDAKTYTFGPLLLQHMLKRGFGKDPHTIEITGEKYAINSDDLETIA